MEFMEHFMEHLMHIRKSTGNSAFGKLAKRLMKYDELISTLETLSKQCVTENTSEAHFT
jgi:hypothetical protein